MKQNFEFRFLNFEFRVCDSLKSAIKNQKSKITAGVAIGAALAANASHFDGSRTTPVHRIPLTAEDGQPIVSSVPNTLPMSTRMTCGACHDYDEIHSGTHFGGAGQGRATEPWIAVDEKTGMQIPADRLHLSAWEFTKRFGSHLPGGGVSDPADKLADPDARWDISGGLEMNCLACHNLSHRQDMTEWTKQIGRENFRWAGTAAAGLGEVGGMASRMPDWWDIYLGGSPDDKSYRVPPTVNYDETLFDSKHRAWLDIGKPMNRNCLQCHSTHPVGSSRMEVPGDVHAAAGLSCTDCHRNGEDHRILRGTTETMSCAACHEEGGKIAGQAGAMTAHHKGLPPVHFEKMTCTACHSGAAPADEPTVIRTSRANKLGIYGRAQWYTDSPFIVEPVFVKNDDGKIEPRRMMWPAYWADANGEPLPEETVTEAAVGILDTANQIAAVLATFGNAENESGELVAPGDPVFISAGKAYVQNADGGLDLIGENGLNIAWAWKTPSNIVSTIPEFDVNAKEVEMDAEAAIKSVMKAFEPVEVVAVTKGRLFSIGEDGWLAGTNTALADGWYTKDGEPLVTPFAEKAVTDVIGTTKSFNEEQVAAVLKKIGNGATYIAAGRMFKLEGDKLTDIDHKAAEPVSWPLGHDVRGSAQALGATSCKDCHASDSAFLFGSVTATSPLLTDKAQTVSMHEFMGISKGFNKMFGTTFKVRKAFKCYMSNMALLLTLIVLAAGLPLIYRLVTNLSEKEFETKPVKMALMGAMLILALTGFLFGWPFSYPLGGFPLLTHVGAGALYAVVLLVWAALRVKSAGVWGWALIVSGIVLILSVLIAMFPLLGTHGQHNAIVIHRIAAIVSIAAAVLACRTAKKQQ